jgi:hypothetical protein
LSTSCIEGILCAAKLKDPHNSIEDYCNVQSTSSSNVQSAEEAEPYWQNLQSHGLNVDTILDEHDLRYGEDGIDKIKCNVRGACNLLLVETHQNMSVERLTCCSKDLQLEIPGVPRCTVANDIFPYMFPQCEDMYDDTVSVRSYTALMRMKSTMTLFTFTPKYIIFLYYLVRTPTIKTSTRQVSQRKDVLKL